MRSEATARQDELGDLARQIASQLRIEPPRSENVVRPNFPRVSATRPEQVAAMNAIVRAADQMGVRKEQITVAVRRAQEAEEKIETLKRQISDTEDRLAATADLLEAERKRVTELERRSAEMLDRTQAMITDASERLQISEKRAAVAEEYLGTLQTLIRERFED